MHCKANSDHIRLSACRIALHLQLAMQQTSRQERQHSRAVVPALSAASRAVDSIHTRQSTAEQDMLAQQQEHGHVADTSAAAAANAVMSSCEVARQVLEQMQGLGACKVAALMVCTHPW